jgi:hypothetical protein
LELLDEALQPLLQEIIPSETQADPGGDVVAGQECPPIDLMVTAVILDTSPKLRTMTPSLAFKKPM